MDQEQKFLSRVLDISRQMAETRQLDPLLEYAMDQAMQLVGAEHGYIVLLQEAGSLDFRVKRGLDKDGKEYKDESQEPNDQISMTILSKVISTGQPEIVHDAESDPNWRAAKSVALLKLRSVMCVPLVAHAETIGAIYVENRSIKGRFHDESLAPLTLFANQAAVSIENAALNDDLEARVTARTRELEQAMSQVEQSWTEAVEANRLRTMLLGNVAHDLRSPLSIVIESLHMLQEGIFGDLNPDQLTWISKSLEAAHYVLNLTNDVFDLTKLEMGGLVLYRQDMDMNDFLGKIHSIGEGLPWPQSVKFLLDLEDNLPTASIDPIRISQVLLNLLSNALKFTAEGNVTLYARRLDNEEGILIGVSDTGDGIPADKLDQLFQRFQQIDSVQERRRLGTGLGLAICRELVEMHGGHIWVESEIGRGTDFKFTLPLAATSTDSLAETSQAAGAQEISGVL